MSERSESPVTTSAGRTTQALPVIDPITNKPADDAVNPAFTFALSVFNTDIEPETLDVYIAEYVPQLVDIAFDEWFARKGVTSASEFWSGLIAQIIGMHVDNNAVADCIVEHLSCYSASYRDGHELDADDVEFLDGLSSAIEQSIKDEESDDSESDSTSSPASSSASSSALPHSSDRARALAEAFGHSDPPARSAPAPAPASARSASAELHSLIDGSRVGITRTSRGKLFLVSVKGTKLFNPFNGKPLFSVNGMLSDLDTHKALPWCRSVLLGSELVDEASGERVKLPA